MRSKRVLICDKCGAENWNLASEGKNHDREANPVKGHRACAGIWRLPARLDADRRAKEKLLKFPERKT